MWERLSNLSPARLGGDAAHTVGFVLVLAAAALVPQLLADYNVNRANAVAIAAIAAMALNLVMGIAGLVTAGTAVLLAIGAYSAATLAIYLHWPFPLVLFASTLMGALVGVVVGTPSLRVRGIYLVVSTIALHFIVIYILSNYQSNRVGSAPFLMPTASFLGWKLQSSTSWFYFLLLVVALAYLCCRNLRLSRFGRAWLLNRDAPLVAASQGISHVSYNLLAFVISSALTALAGVLLAYNQTVVYVDGYTLELAIEFIAILVIGGMGSTGGAIAGTVFVYVLPILLERLVKVIPVSGSAQSALQANIGDIQLILYGVLLIIFLVFLPGGFASLGRKTAAYLGGALRKMGNRDSTVVS